jgi:hypothetical protein
VPSRNRNTRLVPWAGRLSPQPRGQADANRGLRGPTSERQRLISGPRGWGRVVRGPAPARHAGGIETDIAAHVRLHVFDLAVQAHRCEVGG